MIEQRAIEVKADTAQSCHGDSLRTGGLHRPGKRSSSGRVHGLGEGRTLAVHDAARCSGSARGAAWHGSASGLIRGWSQSHSQRFRRLCRVIGSQ